MAPCFQSRCVLVCWLSVISRGEELGSLSEDEEVRCSKNCRGGHSPAYTLKEALCHADRSVVSEQRPYSGQSTFAVLLAQNFDSLHRVEKELGSAFAHSARNTSDCPWW
jgi:hypothetical protein